MLKQNAEITQAINDHPDWVFASDPDSFFRVDGDLPAKYAMLNLNEEDWVKEPEF